VSLRRAIAPRTLRFDHMVSSLEQQAQTAFLALASSQLQMISCLSHRISCPMGIFDLEPALGDLAFPARVSFPQLRSSCPGLSAVASFFFCTWSGPLSALKTNESIFFCSTFRPGLRPFVLISLFTSTSYVTQTCFARKSASLLRVLRTLELILSRLHLWQCVPCLHLSFSSFAGPVHAILAIWWQGFLLIFSDLVILFILFIYFIFHTLHTTLFFGIHIQTKRALE